VVIDEQHKFGVHQRARVRRLGVDPHYLVMTATPIPRTAALTVFGDLDVSIIRELPPGRQPVKTRWLAEDKRPRLHDYLARQLQQKRQAFVVCPLVEESSMLEARAAIETHAQLADGPFKAFRLGLLHGRQDEEVKARVMSEFRAGAIDLLVCTSVVEVGVDVPNATLLVVEHAERFGLSQLHQLRGRVSRGETAGECYLFADPASAEARERLMILTRTTDGFRLAEEDLKLRGLGQFFGAKQHGLGELRLGNLIHDADLLSQARRDAFAVVLADAGLHKPENAPLRTTMLTRYGEALDLASVG
jgi:ATP-dependent DNA helicase RecG